MPTYFKEAQEADGKRKSKVQDGDSYISRLGNSQLHFLVCRIMGGMSDTEHGLTVDGSHPLDPFSPNLTSLTCFTVASLFKTDLQIQKY